MQVYLVGGAVRDTLLGLPIHERDWVVVGGSAAALLERGYRQVGRDFPVFLHPDTAEEYALARRERKTGHGYHGFSIDSDTSVTLEEDLARRDLTVNAMAMDAEGRLIDPWGGERDLHDRVLRHVSIAFAEDPLRVLRVARFMARFAHLGFRVHPQTMELMRDIVASGELRHLVAERIWGEMHRALGEPAPQAFVRTLRACGALAVVLPEVDALFGVPQPVEHHPEIDTGEHVLLALQEAAARGFSAQVRFAVLVHDVGKGLTPPDQWPTHIGHERAGAPLVDTLCARLRVPGAWRELALLVCLHHTRCHQAPRMRAPALVRLLEDLDALRQRQRFEAFLDACEADARGRTGFEQRDYRSPGLLRRVRDVALAITAADALERGLTGAEIARDLHQRRCEAVARALAEGFPESPGDTPP